MKLIGAELTAAALILLWPACAPAQGNREISGIVVNTRTGAPVIGADLTVRQSRDGKIVGQTSSDSEGHFSFPNLGDGKFALIATGKGYVPSAYQEHEPGVSTAIVTGESMISTGLRFELMPQARITGQVQEDSGDPVPQARVSLYRKAPNGTGAMARAGVIYTNQLGKFDFTGLREGTYFACAFGSPWYASPAQLGGRMGPEEVSARRRSTLDVAYPPTCYPEVTDPLQAEAIRVNAGDVLPLTIIMHPVPAMHIVMQIPRPDEKHPYNPPQFAIRMFGIEEQISSSSSFSVENNGGDANPPARMEISGIAAGQYEVSAQGQNGEATRQLNVDVAADHPTLDMAAASPLAELTGEVVTAAGETLRPGSFVWLRARHGGDSSTAPVMADGTFTFRALRPDDYEVNVGVPQNSAMAIASMAAQGGALSGRVLKVGIEPVKLAIVVGEARAALNGIVTRQGRPAAGVFVLLAPSDSRAVGARLQTNQSDSDGSFNFFHVPAGTFIVVAIEEGWKLDWARPQAIAPYLARGVKITVPANAATVNLPQAVEAQPASSANPL